MENPAENAQEPLESDDVLFGVPAEDPEDDEPLDDPAPSGRQGLPSGFRMRHDAHYVEELMGSAPRFRPDVPPVRVGTGPRAIEDAVTTPAPAPPFVAQSPAPAAGPAQMHADDARASVPAAIETLADRLDLVSGYATAARRPAAPLVAFHHALQVELNRASRLARAAVFMSGEVPLARRPVTAHDLVDRAMRAIAPLRRFSGIRFDVSIDTPAFELLADPAAATQALAGALDAFAQFIHAIDSADDGGDFRLAPRAIRVDVRCVAERPAMLVEISTTGVPLSDEGLSRFFDPASRAHPGGTEPALLLSAAARIVRAHGGRADVRRAPDGAVAALFVLPRGAGAA